MPSQWQQSGIRYLWISAIVIGLDQLTKSFAVSQLDLYQSIAVFPGLNWTLIYNYGAAFSLLSDQPGWQRWAFSILALAVSGVLIIWLRKTSSQHRLQSIPLSLVVGGALGNVYDRVSLGYVVDFIDVYYKTHHWPAFNVADSAICVGAVLLLIDSFIESQRSKANSNEAKKAP